MVVEKQQSPINQISFTCKNNALDMCKSYPYLGTIISHNGQFKFNINEFCKKASRAMYTLIDLCNKMIYTTYMHLLLSGMGASFFSSKLLPRDFLSEK